MAVINVNGKSVQANADPRTPLLWVLRDTLGMTGTKYGCGIAQCGSCTVHIDGVATRSCQVPLSAVSSGKKVVTDRGHRPGRQAEQDPGRPGSPTTCPSAATARAA
jgi:isoquinoline 1-oxidoreductase alpha subunit